MRCEIELISRMVGIIYCKRPLCKSAGKGRPRMNEQEKKAERMIKLTICLCSLLILLKAGQAVLSRYENPKELLLHEAVARTVLLGKAWFLPALHTEASQADAAGQLMAQAAAFLGWDTAEDTGLYVEDEYTRQELIEAGRGGSLSDIRKENSQAASETENDKEKSQINPSEIQDTEEKTDTGATEGEALPDASVNQWENTTPSTDTAGEETQQFPRVSALASAEKTMTSKELLKKYFIVDPVTEVKEERITFEKLAQPDLSLSPAKEGEKQILIYHTHSQEGFRDSVKHEEDTTIVGVGTYLSQLLTEKGYQVLHLTDTFDLTGGGIDRNQAYTNARKKLKEVLADNPSIQVILDIHRDGVSENKRLVTTIDGRPTAKIMFFNGMSYKASAGELSSLPNPYIQENLAFSFQTEYLCDYYYPSFSRCIYLKAYRYNLDLLPRSMLVEVGAQTNTVQEAKNAMIPLADVLHKLLQGT